MVKYRILFNASTSIVGGGMKNSALFINQSLHMKTEEFEWYYAITFSLYEMLKQSNVSLPENRVYVFDKTPSRSKSSRKRLKAIAAGQKFDLVYTMAGPAYVSFQQTHVMGISNPYVTHAGFESIAIRSGIKSKIKKILNSIYLMLHARRADYFFFQTEFSRRSFHNRFFVDRHKSFVIPNAFDQEMSEVIKIKPYTQTPSKIKVFCPASGYPHKLIQMVPKLSYHLSQLHSGRVEFVITIPENDSIWRIISSDIIRFRQDKLIHNIGRYKYSDSIKHLNNCDIVFVPSILETFSASYLEAMVAKRILIVADRKHAHDICGDAAFYVEPTDPLETAKAFIEIFNNPKLCSLKIKNGLEQLKKYPSQMTRYDLIEKAISNILKTT